MRTVSVIALTASGLRRTAHLRHIRLHLLFRKARPGNLAYPGGLYTDALPNLGV
jgi:hypothetical protein